MKRTYWTLFYVAALAVDLVILYVGDVSLRPYSKSALMPLLMGMVLHAGPRGASALKVLLLAALFFSWAGDALLLFEPEGPEFFMAGLGAFLVAQVAYSVALGKLRIRKGVRFRLVGLVPVIAFYVCLIGLLWDHLGALRTPVLVYGAVISTMLAMAVQLVPLKNRKSAALLFGGALLFVASDTVLALQKFYWKTPSPHYGLLIMSTYGLAQLFLTLGLLNHSAPVPVPQKSEQARRMELLN
ncbi:lysoplasmalogenase [Flaviaesturariibacter amylovorans]|uniref:Lysoplasmalogenase n=1 Tax=Flaviaesturariibacter amylovorans TaxID=1084520 RepID=A0ABP8GC34_9BACT